VDFLRRDRRGIQERIEGVAIRAKREETKKKAFCNSGHFTILEGVVIQ
jgi:hypothetical protein